MTTRELLEYYSGLLIRQYITQPKAVATIQAFVRGFLMAQTSVQTVAFATAPASGAFRFNYDGVDTASIAWNDSAGTIQTDLQAITGLGSVTVAGSIASLLLTITFTGVIAPAVTLVVDNNTLLNSGSQPVLTVVDETDLTLPLAVMNGYNLIGNDTAVGAQLDVLGKYAGVTRAGVGIYGQPITLVDSDFLNLIRMAIVTNNSGSSLETIIDNLNSFFPNDILVTDYKTMRISYLISSALGSQDLFEMFISQRLLPKPMGVQVSVAIVPSLTNIFAFRTYSFTVPNGKPFNRYTTFNTTWKWLRYSDVI